MKDSRILFLNQVAGPLFRELAEDIAISFGKAELLSGHMDDIAREMSPALDIVPGPDYDRSNLLARGWSWSRFLFRALRMVFRSSPDRMLFIVSNPPFLPLVGWLASVIRGQRYCMLVYDVYPAVLIKLGKISKLGPVALLWRAFNRLIWSRAEVVFTIGEHMAANMRLEAPKMAPSRVQVVPIWVDVDFIKPIPQRENPFLISLGWQDRKIILYSGNLGNTHNLDGLLKAAQQLKGREDLGFLIIGSGALWGKLENEIKAQAMENVKLLPFQPEHMLPQTLPAGDLSIVSMEAAIAGFMIPSKTFYYMAAGSAIVALVPSTCEVADVVKVGGCGVRLDPDDADGIANAIISLVDDCARLSAYKTRARELAETHYSRANTDRYIEVLRSVLSINR
ncbi:glycosyltransferase family 4 protein [Akkermansiaceae bacterium]|nr:glycosyltransferase family 4 protein [Akkermansiaceae bacterium]